MWGAIAAAAIPAITGMLGQDQANHINETLANQANATEVDLANTAMQRRVNDLKQAGLNPMLAYTQGGGSGAATPQMVVPHIENKWGAASSAAANAGIQMLLSKSQIETQKSQQVLNGALGTKAVAEADAAAASAAEARARTAVYGPQVQEILARVDQIASQTGLNFAQTALVKREALNAVLHGGQIVADTGNKEADTKLKQLGLNIDKEVWRQQMVKTDAAESPLGRYVMPFMPFASGTAAAVHAGR